MTSPISTWIKLLTERQRGRLKVKVERPADQLSLQIDLAKRHHVLRLQFLGAKRTISLLIRMSFCTYVVEFIVPFCTGFHSHLK
jgi:hypothetical protein